MQERLHITADLGWARQGRPFDGIALWRKGKVLLLTAQHLEWVGVPIGAVMTHSADLLRLGEGSIGGPQNNIAHFQTGLQGGESDRQSGPCWPQA